MSNPTLVYPNLDKMSLNDLIILRNDVYGQIKNLERTISLGHGFKEWSYKYEKLCYNRELYEQVKTAIKDYCWRHYGSDYFAFKKEARFHYQRYKDRMPFTTFLKHLLMEHIGTQCGRCRILDTDVLSFDHIYDDGQPDRDCFKSQTEYYLHYLMNLEIAKKRLQVLCMNCNVKKATRRHKI